MNGQMRKYKESLARTEPPVLLSQMKQRLNLKALLEYARQKGVKVIELTEQEKMAFIV